MTVVAELVVAADPEPWRRAGLDVVDDAAHIGGVRIRFDPEAGSGVVAWGLAGLPGDHDAPAQIDGLATYAAESSCGVSGPGIVGFDHLVVMTSSLERTCAAIEADTGHPLRRVREAGSVRQGFHRLGEVIVEVVESAEVHSDRAAFWGFVWNVADIHETCAVLGPELISLPRPAVQPGRMIASFRTAAGLGIPTAIMSSPPESDPS